jgi:hypothetical protein
MAATASLVLLAGCHSGPTNPATEPAQMVGPGGKVYTGTQNQVSEKVGQDYGAGLKAMAEQRGK